MSKEDQQEQPIRFSKKGAVLGFFAYVLLALIVTWIMTQG
jgi:hypothetical protein